VIADLHGWNGVQETLSKLARNGRWHDMPAQITDAMLDEFAVSGTWAELPGKIRGKYGRLLDRVSYYIPFVPGQQDAQWQATVAGFQA
jgi:hypothetical protein